MPDKMQSLVPKHKGWSERPTPSFDVRHLVPKSECADGNNICNDNKFSSHNNNCPNTNEIALV